MNNMISIQEPSYFYRNYINDFGLSEEFLQEPSYQRVALVVLPFLSLYKPLNFALSLGMGSCRAVSNISDLYLATQRRSREEILSQLLQTAVSVTAVACTVLAHPLGMLVSTTQDIVIESFALMDHLEQEEYAKALESSANIINNTLYLGLLVVGGVELSIASLSMQIIMGVHHSRKELLQGNYPEAIAHAAMVCIRANQLKAEVDSLFKETDPKGSFEIKEEIKLSKEISREEWFTAIIEGDVEKVKSYSHEEYQRSGYEQDWYEVKIDPHFSEWYSPLYLAIESDNLEVIQAVLEAGYSPNGIQYGRGYDEHLSYPNALYISQDPEIHALLRKYM